jgi:hypothetical protein
MQDELRVVRADRGPNRGVSKAAASDWRGAEAAFRRFLGDAGVGPDTITWSTEVYPVPLGPAGDAVDRLAQATKDDGVWSYLTTSGDGDGFLLAMPVGDNGVTRPHLLPYVELHSKAVAWWLTCVWRVRQLGLATSQLAEDLLTVPAAATARSLVESVAAFDHDGRRIRDAWSLMKQAGPAILDEGAAGRHRDVSVLFQELVYGAKFTDSAPEAKATWSDRRQRVNVLTQLRHYAKRVAGGAVLEDYEWLCNAVHPSIGTTFVYSTDPFVHDTRTHADRLWSEQPTMVVGRSGASEPGHIETTVARSATTALTAGLQIARSALRVVDDIALTTDAPSIYRRESFRALRPAARNEPCPCGSGAKGKRCAHAWGDPARSFPDTYGP